MESLRSYLVSDGPDKTPRMVKQMRILQMATDSLLLRARQTADEASLE